MRQITPASVTLFGQIAITIEGKTMTEEEFHSPMISKLLAYLLINHSKRMSVSELSEALWPDSEIDSPAGALKNLVYRLRQGLKQTWPDLQLVKASRGFYFWNEDLDFTVDTEEFESVIQNIATEEQDSVKRALYGSALSFYKGKCIQTVTDSYWAISYSTYYHSLYLSAVKKYAELLEADGNDETIEMVLQDALCHETLDEDLYVLYLTSLINQNKIAYALQQYQKATYTLYNNLGVRESDALLRIHNQISSAARSNRANISQVVRVLKQDFADSGAFFCEWNIFKKIYQLELKRSERLGISIFMALITINITSESTLPIEQAQKLATNSRDKLQSILIHSLRGGDVIAKYNEQQFVVLLPTCQQETAKKVMHRIEASYYSKKPSPRTYLEYDIFEVI